MNPIYNAIVYIVWFFATYYTVFFTLSLFAYKNRLFDDKKTDQSYRPLVSFLIPAFNEEDGIADTISSVKKIDYDRVEFIIMNDGSTDNTSRIVRGNIKGDNRFRFIDNKENKGKAGVLNEGIGLARGELIASMDADSVVEPDIIRKVLPYFTDKKVGAVTVSVEVNNPKTFLHKIISLEFALGLSLFLKIFSFLDCVFVTPGPFSVYRKSVLLAIGGYDIQNVTEDHEIAYRLHKGNYRIENCMEAKVYTTLPMKFKDIYVQRRRWYSGAIQSLIQHRDMMFRKKYKLFGYFTPFNMFLIAIGLTLFFSSTYLLVSKLVQNILYYRYTNFNFFQHIRFDWDILAYGRVNFLGISMITATVLLMLLGIKFTKKRYRDNKMGLLGYPFLFFLYQIFWGGAILAVIRRKKIRWR